MKKTLIAVALLSLSTGALAADLSPSCQQYAQTMEKYLAMMDGNADLKPQADMLRQQYEQTKAQLAQASTEAQEAQCKPALDAMAQVMKQMDAAK